MEEMLKRLETAVSKLENAITRVENLEKKLLSGGSTTGGSTTGSGDEPKSVEEFDRLVRENINPLVELAKKIGAQEIVGVSDLLAKVCDEQKKLIVLASKSKKPSENDIPAVVNGLSLAINGVMEFNEKKENKFSKDYKNHLSAIGDSISVFAWVIQPTPFSYSKEFAGTASFWTNKILQAYKGKNEDQVNWANNYTNFLKELPNYIKQFHTSGLTWNPSGGNWK
eukprot:TRINITY_DN14026_c0_g1_i1.p1 TRINITY_DN14026_c0_g1~~TRINITY_DN14026_c0_g1_i1.p1  ORF type:complete len:244 (+),score=86.11 TRINITY_DN14026_c0_g1_i1:60-734(+)